MFETAALWVAGTVFVLILWLSLASIRHEAKRLSVDPFDAEFPGVSAPRCRDE